MTRLIACVATSLFGVIILWSFSARAVEPENRPGRGVTRMQQAVTPGTVIQSGNYVLIAWNDLGMHCISPQFKEMAILPPYNTIRAIVIRKGSEPRVVTSGITINYSIDNNTTVVGKSDFWTYATQLFGRALTPGIGLTGNGLSGKLTRMSGYFEATGIPALPFTDNMQWEPYQHATLTMSGTNVVGQTTITVPVSDEMNCQKCHSSRPSIVKVPPLAAQKSLEITRISVEQNILSLHDRLQGTQLLKSRPVLCASCHSDNALGTPGIAGVPSLSYAMHVKHAAARPQPLCQDCHPGAKTQCNRSAIVGMGPTGDDPGCANCHGNLDKVSADLKAGRRPWLEEPTCAQCHGTRYSTGTFLYREAKGHGGVFCVACHNSPHAWLPSKRDDDNAQAMGLQGNNHALGYKSCNVCHTDGRTGTVPPHDED